MKKQVNSRQDDGSMRIAVNNKIYSIEAVRAAVYPLLKKFIINIDQDNNDNFEIEVRCDSGDEELNVEELMRDLLDHQVRIDLEKRFGRLREIIVQHAFSPVGNSDLKKLVTDKSK